MIRQFVLLVLFSGFCCGAEPKPILVVLEQDPWRSVVGSDSPTFALYDDGTIVYLREKPTTEEPFHVRRVAGAKDRVTELLSFDPAKLRALYELSSASDQVTTVIWTPTKRVEIYGSWRQALELGGDSDPRVKAMAERERKMWESLPTEIRAALARIDQERAIEGKAWFPEAIEIMFWPYEYAPDESIIWPKDWPALAAKDTRKRGDSFSVFLPSVHLSELRSFLATQKGKGAVLIDGKKMAAATRFPFPG